MRRRIIVVALLLVLLALGLFGWSIIRHGLSAHDEPSAFEAFAARAARSLALPASYKSLKNPYPPTPENLRESLEHFADHCAVCHANDGSGQTDIGQNLYPKAPDMRRPETQSLSDGELFYIIHNGIRLTGMPAWGKDPPEKDEDSWKLVHFIRHLPELRKEELEEMETMNPISRRELERQEEERRFLEGEQPHFLLPSSTLIRGVRNAKTNRVSSFNRGPGFGLRGGVT